MCGVCALERVALIQGVIIIIEFMLIERKLKMLTFVQFSGKVITRSIKIRYEKS